MYLSDFVFFSVTLSLLALMAIMSAWDHVGHYTDWDKKVHVITSGKLNRPVIVQVPDYQTALRAPKQEVLVECDCRDWATWNNEGIETPACCRNDTVAALKSLVSVLDDSNIKYSLESGTLLGAVRCGEFIQYDYDVDITVESPEPFLVKAALDKWHRHDTDNIFDRMTVHLTGLPWPQTEIEGSYQSHVMVDIHIVDRLTKTQPCLYEGVMMRCTEDYRALLTEKYGKDWMIPHRWDNSRKEGLDEAIDMKQLNHCVEKRETMRHLCEEFPDVIVGEKHCNGTKIMIAIPTHNRKGYTKFNADVIQKYHKIPSEELFIFDDCSTQYGEKELREWYGPDINYFPCTKKLLADSNIRRMFKYFSTSNYDIIFSVDSDTLFQSNWRSFILDNMNKTDGMMSLYHSAAKWHQTYDCDDVLCKKTSVGSAGSVMTRDVVTKMLKNNKNKAFDWGFVDYFKKKGINMFVPLQSIMFHYGKQGQNNGCDTQEVARNFNRTVLPEWIKAGLSIFYDKCSSPDIMISVH